MNREIFDSDLSCKHFNVVNYIVWDYFDPISEAPLSPVVSTCFFAGMINTEKKYCAEVRMASFPGSAASLIPRLSPPPVFERRVTWNKAMQRM